jgi:hypothetical protein
MIKALLLVCSFIAAPEVRLCDQRNATQVINVPEEFDNPVTCAMHGQAYLAETSLSPSAGEYLRICLHQNHQSNYSPWVKPCRKVGMTLAIARMTPVRSALARSAASSRTSPEVREVSWTDICSAANSDSKMVR